jgi:hypothetical protein
MKTAILCLVGCLVMATTGAACEFRIEYSYAGLINVQVTKQRQLHFTWHTGRLPYENGDNSPIVQSLEGYDRHASVIWLTKLELADFKNWIEKNGILYLKSTYPEPENTTYGSAFHSSLTVELDGKTHSVNWTDDTEIPESLRDAVNKLVGMSRRIWQGRSGQ